MEFEKLQEEHRQRFKDFEEGLIREPQGETESYFESLDDIAKLTYDINEAHNPSKLDKYVKALKHVSPHEGFLAYLFILSGLEATEVAETMEDLRESDTDFLHILEEQADVFIRSMNTMQIALKYAKENNLIPPDTSMSKIIKQKIAKNIERPLKHGGKRF